MAFDLCTVKSQFFCRHQTAFVAKSKSSFAVQFDWSVENWWHFPSELLLNRQSIARQTGLKGKHFWDHTWQKQSACENNRFQLSLDVCSMLRRVHIVSRAMNKRSLHHVMTVLDKNKVFHLTHDIIFGHSTKTFLLSLCHHLEMLSNEIVIVPQKAVFFGGIWTFSLSSQLPTVSPFDLSGIDESQVTLRHWFVPLLFEREDINIIRFPAYNSPQVRNFDGRPFIFVYNIEPALRTAKSTPASPQSLCHPLHAALSMPRPKLKPRSQCFDIDA